MLKATKLYCLLYFIPISLGFRSHPTPGTCPPGCECIVSDPFHLSASPATSTGPPATSRAVTCSGLRIGNLKELAESLPPHLGSLTLKNNGLLNLMDLCCFTDLQGRSQEGAAAVGAEPQMIQSSQPVWSRQFDRCASPTGLRVSAAKPQDRSPPSQTGFRQFGDDAASPNRWLD